MRKKAWPLRSNACRVSQNEKIARLEAHPNRGKKGKKKSFFIKDVFHRVRVSQEWSRSVRNGSYQVVDGMKVHVFGVPSKCGFPHSEVQVGCVHAVDFNIVIFVHPVQNRSEVLNVPVLE
jgi:hypothetical protein